MAVASPRETAVALSIAVQEEMERRQGELDELDGIAGDGDHGATMVMGSRAVTRALRAAPADAPIGALLKIAAAAFADVGGSIGPLWGTGLLRAGQVLGDARSPARGDLARAIQLACQGIEERGGARPGDKTLVDVLTPASVALSEATDSQRPMAEVMNDVSTAARHGLDDSIHMTARRGRARRFGERSVGHPDPGAASACYIIETLCRSLVRDDNIEPADDSQGV